MRIETARLLIRPLTRDDAEALLAFWGDAANERFLGSTPPSSVDDLFARTNQAPWCVWERASGELVGDCFLFFADEHDEWELAYGFRRDRWGRGYATEAAGACVRHGFDALGLQRIVADVDPSNRASKRVLEKLGFSCAGVENGLLLYELTRDAWSRSHISGRRSDS